MLMSVVALMSVRMRVGVGLAAFTDMGVLMSVLRSIMGVHMIAGVMMLVRVRVSVAVFVYMSVLMSMNLCHFVLRSIVISLFITKLVRSVWQPEMGNATVIALYRVFIVKSAQLYDDV